MHTGFYASSIIRYIKVNLGFSKSRVLCMYNRSMSLQENSLGGDDCKVYSFQGEFFMFKGPT